MPLLKPGADIKRTLAVGDVVRIVVEGAVAVTVREGPSSERVCINATTQDLGPYGSAVEMRIEVMKGLGQYEILTATDLRASVADLEAKLQELEDRPREIVVRTRQLTDENGTVNWSFPEPFTGDAVPVLTVAIESEAEGFFSHRILSLSTASVAVSVLRASPVLVSGVEVLGIQPATQITVHLTATSP